MAGLADYFTQINQRANATATPPPVGAPGVNVVQDTLNAFTGSNSQLMEDARRQGLAVAAQRGGINSSIAAGASQRSALDTAMAASQQAIDIDLQREQRAWEEWSTQQNFNRAMFGQLSQGAFSSTLNMLQSVQQYALEDPELYTPDVVSGYTEFFTRNFDDIFSRFFNPAAG